MRSRKWSSNRNGCCSWERNQRKFSWDFDKTVWMQKSPARSGAFGFVVLRRTPNRHENPIASGL